MFYSSLNLLFPFILKFDYQLSLVDWLRTTCMASERRKLIPVYGVLGQFTFSYIDFKLMVLLTNVTVKMTKYTKYSLISSCTT